MSSLACGGGLAVTGRQAGENRKRDGKMRFSGRYLAELNVRERLSLLHQPGLGLPLVPVDDQDGSVSAQTPLVRRLAPRAGLQKHGTHLNSGGYCSTIQATSKQ